jgi:glycosyltransferase involved in cell wall biosynthesis
MHLGLDLLFLVPEQTGGREIYSRELLAALRADEPDLRVTAFVNRDTAEAGRGFWTDHADHTIVLPRVSVDDRASWALGELAGVSRAAARAGIDVLHGPANFIPPTGPFARVVTLHDLMFRLHPELLGRAMRWGTELLLPPGARRAHRIVTGAEAARQEIVAELGIPPERIAVVPHGIGRPGAGGDAAAGRRMLDAGDRPIALAVGSHIPHKNLAATLAGIAAIDATERPLLAVAGRGTDGADLAEHARELGIAADVRLLGGVDHDRLEDLYAAASVLVITTRHEGFGLTVLEAMTRGVPVVCSDLPVLREVAADAAVFADPDAPDQVAAGVRRVLAGGPGIDALRVRARDNAARFSWAAAARATRAAYDVALSERGRRSRRPGS